MVSGLSIEVAIFTWFYFINLGLKTQGDDHIVNIFSQIMNYGFEYNHLVSTVGYFSRIGVKEVVATK